MIIRPSSHQSVYRWRVALPAEFVFAAEFQPLKVSNVPSHRMGLDHPNAAIEYHVGPK